ncbi:MAG: hypothetical protein WC986_14455 [Elusimicrobiota bacterium]|jgi:hypothetical protein
MSTLVEGLVGALLLAAVFASLWATGWAAMRADRRWGLNLFHGYDEHMLLTAFLGFEVYTTVFAIGIAACGLFGILLPAIGHVVLSLVR